MPNLPTKFNLKAAIEKGKENQPSPAQNSLSNKSGIPAGSIKTSVTPAQTLAGKYHDAVADFVTGKTNEKPNPKSYGLKPINKNEQRPTFNLRSAIQNSKNNSGNASKADAGNNRSVLYGTGFTKKLVARQESALKKQSEEIANEKIDETSLEAKERSLAERHSQSLQIAAKTITLDESQQEALDGLAFQRFGCLIGSAGVGKTTLEKMLIERLKNTLIVTNDNNQSLSMALVAFTGRAVQQIKRAIPLEYHSLCRTIHSFLGYAPVLEEYFDTVDKVYKERKVFRPTFTKDNPLPHKLIFVDEAGMVPVYLWNQLIEACPQARIVLIGDINQLPPVQGKSVLGFAMCSWPTYELRKIHRQAEGNPIIMNAHRILNGQLPKVDEQKFAIVKTPDGSLKTQAMFIQVIKKLHQGGKFDPFRDAIIVPKNKDNLGQLVLNEQLVAYFNPDAKRELILCGFIHKSFAVGDKIMLLQNDNERGLTNGQTGIVTNISINDRFDPKRAVQFIGAGNPDMTDFNFEGLDKHLNSAMEEERLENEADTSDDPNQRQSSHRMMVRFPLPDGMFEEVELTTVGQFAKITHAYAFTCHKSQGGEYPTVIILCHYSDMRMLTREWLYTAVTRASERVILCCNDRGLLQALHTQKISGRTVQEKAKKFLALQGNEKIEPILPAPERIEFDEQD